jgi:hypothetical protein
VAAAASLAAVRRVARWWKWRRSGWSFMRHRGRVVSGGYGGGVAGGCGGGLGEAAVAVVPYLLASMWWRVATWIMGQLLDRAEYAYF